MHGTEKISSMICLYREIMQHMKEPQILPINQSEGVNEGRLKPPSKFLVMIRPKVVLHKKLLVNFESIKSSIEVLLRTTICTYFDTFVPYNINDSLNCMSRL